MEAGRPLVLAAVLAALSAAAVGLGVCIAVALAGWFLAEGGGHGQATDAVRIGADVWLSGHGVTIDAAAGPLGITPLGLTLLLIVIGHRSGRRRAEVAAPGAWGLPLAVGTATYIVVALLVVVFASRADAAPGLLPALVGALVVGALGLGSGLARGSGVLTELGERLPVRVHEVGEVALAGAGLVFATGAVAVLVSLALSFTRVANVFTALDLTPGNALIVLLVSALVIPNVVLLAVSYLAGPGFAVGAGTSVTTTAVTLGPLPAFPLLAALPAPGPGPAWMGLVLAVPGVCAATAAGLAQTRAEEWSWSWIALRGFLGGIGGAVLLWLAVCMAGGPMGTGRMADIGAQAGPVLVTLVGAMALGGLIGALPVALWQRRRADR
jgi:hypothetical protein